MSLRENTSSPLGVGDWAYIRTLQKWEEAAPKTPTPPLTTKLGYLRENISFLFYFRSFLLKGYFFPPSLVSCPQSPSAPFVNERIQALGPPSRNWQPSPLGAHFTGESKNTMRRGIKVVNMKSEFEIDDHALTTSTGNFSEKKKKNSLLRQFPYHWRIQLI